MSEFSSYGIIIGGSLVIIISYFFNRLAKKTNIPSVLLLIFLGIILRQIDQASGFLKGIDLMPILEILGIIGLIMIVLEGALDLKITKDKIPLVIKSFLLALLGLLINAFLIAWIIKSIWFSDLDWYVSYIYAIPLAIMSSAIIIPSVMNLGEDKKEFMVYESTFSDILGIMFFYFLLEAGHSESGSQLAWSITGNIGLTIIISFAASYFLIYIFQKIRSGTKFFLMIAALILLYALGKQLHLSSLLIVLVFGIVLSNHRLFTGGKLKRFFISENIESTYSDFSMVTQESSFVVRTFFFFIFGLSISLSTLFQSKVILISLLILAGIYSSRFLLAKLFLKKKHFPEWLIAPRGLITILLFYSIPADYQINGSDEFQGILLFVILVTSLIMAYSLIRNSRRININTDDVEFIIENNESSDMPLE